MTISVSPQGMAYTRALKSEKSFAPLCPVDKGGHMASNDWCIRMFDF